MVFLELSIFRKAFRFIGAVICDVIYTLIATIYEVFITVARLNNLSSDQIQPIYQRITMILTIVMLFYVTFEFVKYVISPDTITDKEKGVGNILKRIIIVVVMIALVPEMFSVAYKLQNRIIETQLISKIIVGSTNADYTTYGNDFSANMLSLFYYYDEDACSGTNAGLINECSEASQTVAEKLEHIRQTGDSDIVDGINLASGKATFKEVNPAIKFNGILAIVVGGFILYILALYSIDVGVRYAQLIFLQVMAPIAIMGYVLPKKDGIFQKWGKQCITTYIDLFMRLIIINFVLLITKVLGDAFQNGDIFAGINVANGFVKTLVYIALVMGLLAFAQRAPKLLEELFPSLGGAGIGFGLNGKNRIEPTTKAFKGLGSVVGTGRRVAGGVGGAVAGAVKNHRSGLIGMAKGAKAGAKAGSSKDRKGLFEGSVVRRMRAANAAGEGVQQSIQDFENNAGKGAKLSEAALRQGQWKEELRGYERRKANMEAYSKAKSNAEASLKDLKFMKQLEGAKAIAQAENNAEAARLIETKMSDIKKKAMRFAAEKDETKRETALKALNAELKAITDAFGTDGEGHARVTFDMEAKIDDRTGKIIDENKAKWGTVNVNVEQAAKVAAVVSKELMDNKQPVHTESRGTITEDGKGGYIVESTNMGDFAFNMGAIEDAVKNADSTLTTSDKYKNAKAYAAGIPDSGK